MYIRDYLSNISTYLLYISYTYIFRIKKTYKVSFWKENEKKSLKPLYK